MSSNLTKDSFVVVLDDDPMIPQIIEKTLSLKVHVFTKAEDLLAKAKELKPSLAFIDIKLASRKNGLEILPDLREAWQFCPIIVITATPEPASIVVSLSTGADDFMRKPLLPDELSARARLRIEEATFKAAKEVVSFGDITVNSAHRSVEGPLGKRFASPIEVMLIACLANAKGNIIDKNTIKYRCWGQIKVTDNALHRKLHAIRQILKDVSHAVTIDTKYGVGFSLIFSEKKAESRAAS